MQSWINQDIEVIQSRLLDSEIGNRDLIKNRTDANNKRLIHTGMANKSPGANARFVDINNSGKSIVMSKVHKAPSPVAKFDQQNNTDFSMDDDQQQRSSLIIMH